MIELNLLPEERRRNIRKKATIHIPVGAVCVSLAGILILTHILFLLLGMNARSLALQLSVKWDQMAMQKDRTDEVAQRINKLKRRLESVRKLARPDLDWARLLSGLNQAMIPGVWLMDFDSATTKGKTLLSGYPERLELTGYSLGRSEEATSNAGRFITSLENNEDFMRYFSEVELVEIKDKAVAGEKAMIFRLICRFKTGE